MKLVVDIESTGFRPKSDLIVEVAAYHLDGRGAPVKVLEEVVREDGFGAAHAGSWVFKHTSLTPEAVVAEGVPVGGVIARLQRAVDAATEVVAYNAAFDVAFLRQRGLIVPEGKVRCIMLAATEALKIPPKKGKEGFAWPSFSRAWEEFMGAPLVQEHRAGDDALKECLLLRRMEEKGLLW
jgi:DNA polymerase III epsilon subunit-like protein